MPIPFDIVVAVDSRFGIGKSGRLPWNLPGELKHFKELTTKTESEGKQNAVIMGRKTWEALPVSFKPLPKRINLVLTRNKRLKTPHGVLKAESLQEALMTVNAQFQNKVEKIFVIGGQEVFQEALKHRDCQRIYLTQILSDFQCDTFFPQNLSDFEKIHESDKMSEKNIDYYYIELLRRSCKKL